MTRTSTQDLQQEFLATLRKGQKTIISALRIWVDTVTTVTPRLLPLTDKLPNVPVPFAGQLPTPEEAIDSAYGLAEQLLATHRKFAEDVLELTAPLMSGRQKNGTTRTAPPPEPKVVQVTPEPKPAVVVLGPKPAAAKADPKPAVVAPEPQPAVVAPDPKPAVVAPDPEPAVVAPEPKPALVAPEPERAVAKADPKPAVVAPEPNPAPAKSPAPKAAAPKAAAPKAAAPKTTAAKSAPRPAAKRTPKAAG
jgi:hypothetical protein